MSAESYDDFVARGGQPRLLARDYYGRGRRQSERKVVRFNGRDRCSHDGVYSPRRYQSELDIKLGIKARMIGERHDTRKHRGTGFQVPG